MNSYVVTNIRLPEEDYVRLKEEATRKRVSLAAVIRQKVSTKKISAKDYSNLLLSLKTDWFTDKDYQGYKKNRADLKERSKKYDW